MKKCLLIVAAALAMSLVGCNGNSELKAKYQAQGEEFATKLDAACQQQDATTILALDDSIRAVEEEVVATGDTAAIAAYKAALKDARMRNGAAISKLKVDNGENREEVLDEVVNDAMNEDVSITTVTRSINAVGRQEPPKKK
jgi:uncharacterized lipoprotein NlpE involved in copper resistance